MSSGSTRNSPRARIRRLPEIDPFRAGERWLQDIRRTREYLAASAYAPAAYRPEGCSGVALEAAAQRYRAEELGRLGQRFATWLRRRLNAFRMR
jgi:hypothetical protein